MLSAVLSLIAPPRCGACAAPAAMGQHLCRPCRAALPWLGADVCPRCALPRPCGPPCPAARAAFDAAWSPLALEGPARALVHALKFGGRTAIADLMAAHIAANAPPGLLDGADVLVPAPTHPSRRRRRGFDQASLLARRLHRRTGLPVVAALERAGPARAQVGAGRSRRRSQVAVRALRPAGPRVVLVDDVHTTGATLEACARALRACGTERVVAVAYARTLP